jgi:hypothetical protein
MKCDNQVTADLWETTGCGEVLSGPVQKRETAQRETLYITENV